MKSLRHPAASGIRNSKGGLLEPLQKSIFEGENMTDVVNEIGKSFKMSETEQKIRYGIGSAAAAIFAPLSCKWQGVLTFLAAETILSAVYGVSPVKRLLHT
jgi:hypothetical protein